MSTLTRMIALACAVCLLAPAAAQAFIIDSDVQLDGTAGRHRYSYALQNSSAPADNLGITSFFLPFFGAQTTALIADSVETPEFWTFDVLAPGTTAWPYLRSDDPGAAGYLPIGIDYTDPDFILRFVLAPPEDIVVFSLRIENAEARLITCNLSDRCSDEDLAQLSATLQERDQWEAARVGGGESLSGFSFASLLPPTVGPGLIMATSGTISYSAPFLPLTYEAATDPVPVSEPSTLLLLGAAVAALVIATRKRPWDPADIETFNRWEHGRQPGPGRQCKRAPFPSVPQALLRTSP